jgi:hypothetical protein
MHRDLLEISPHFPAGAAACAGFLDGIDPTERDFLAIAAGSALSAGSYLLHSVDCLGSTCSRLETRRNSSPDQEAGPSYAYR